MAQLIDDWIVAFFRCGRIENVFLRCIEFVVSELLFNVVVGEVRRMKLDQLLYEV